MRMKEDHMGNGQLKPAYNVQLAVNSEYITGVAAFSNRTDSGTLIPFLNHIQRMQSRSYRDIVADAGYESVRNYLYLEQHGQNCFIKPISYEKQKTKKFKSQFWRVENMEPLEHEDGFLCAGGRKILFTRSSSKKENGFVTTTDYYRCEDCSGCELRSKCFKSSDEAKSKEIRMCVESAEHRKTAFENLLSEKGALLRMNRSIQVEGAFGVLKSDRNFRRFLMRGKTNISTELFLLCLAFDLQKFFSKLQRGKRKSHLFPPQKRVGFFGTENVKSWASAFFTDAQLCYTHFGEYAFEFSTFCSICTLNVAVFNSLKERYFATAPSGARVQRAQLFAPVI